MGRDILRSAARALRFVVAVGLVGWLAYRSGLSGLSSARIDWRWFAAGVALVPFSLGVRAVSLGLLLNHDDRVLGPGQLYRLTVVGAGLGLILPTGAADLWKARYGLVSHGHAEEMVVSAVADKLTSLTAIALMGAAAAAAAGDGVLTSASLALAVVSVLPFLVTWERPWRALVQLIAAGRDVDPVRVARHARPPALLLAKVYAVSLVGWLLTYTIVYASTRTVGADVGVATVFALAPLAAIARLVPISAGGVGLGELTMVALLGRAGVPQALAAQAALVQLGLTVLGPGAVGLSLYAWGRPAAGSEPSA